MILAKPARKTTGTKTKSNKGGLVSVKVNQNKKKEQEERKEISDTETTAYNTDINSCVATKT